MPAAVVDNSPLYSAFCKVAVAACSSPAVPASTACAAASLARLAAHHGEPHFPATPSCGHFFARLLLLLSGHRLGRPHRLPFDQTWPIRLLGEVLQERLEEFCHTRFDDLFMPYMVSSADDRHLLRFLLMQRAQARTATGKPSKQHVHAFASVVGCDILRVFLLNLSAKAEAAMALAAKKLLAAPAVNAAAAAAAAPPPPLFGGFAAVLPPKTPQEVLRLLELAMPLMLRAARRFGKTQHAGLLFHPAVAAAKMWNGEFPPPPPPPLAAAGAAAVPLAGKPLRPADPAAPLPGKLHPLDISNASTSLTAFVSTLQKLLTTEPVRPAAAKAGGGGGAVASAPHAQAALAAKAPMPKPRPNMAPRKRRAASTSSDSSDTSSSSEEDSDSDESDDSTSESSSSPSSSSSSSSLSSSATAAKRRKQLQARRALARRKAARTEDAAKPSAKISPTLLEIVGPKAARPKK